MITTDEAIDHIVTEIKANRPDWTEEQIREMVNLARKYISMSPERFLEIFLEDVDLIKAGRNKDQ
jgi:hypothetical protein